MRTFNILQKISLALTALLVILALPATPALAEKAPFGLKSLEISATEAPSPGQEPDAFGRVLGPADLQAGSHPYALTTTFVLNKSEHVEGANVPAGRGLRDVRVQLPPGFVGNPNATPKCSYTDFNEGTRSCPNDTAVGVATTVLRETSNNVPGGENRWYRDPVYNMETPGGVPAEFGYYAAGVVPILIDASVRTGSDYGITAKVSDIPQVQQVVASTVTIWGVPAEASHNAVRGKCLQNAAYSFGLGEPGEGQWEGSPYVEEESRGKECPAEVPVQPLLTNPTSCGEARVASVSVDDWEEPGDFATEPGTSAGEKVFTKTVALPALSGCEKLDFSPSLSVTPDGTAGSTPTGLNVGVHVSQESTTDPTGLGEADVKSTTVALPPGVQVSPSASDGLLACSNAQVGFEGYEELDASGRQTPVFKPKVYNEATKQEEATLCPDASKLANVRIATPLLEHELTGEVYLAAPQNFAGLPENPFSSLIAMYLVAEEPLTGTLVKLPGKVALNEATGQITTTFENTPQLPFSELKLEFFGTARAPLATPAYCGTYNTEASFVPWSGEPAAHPPASFQITSGPNGSSCTYPGQALPFSPALHSSSSNVQAGAFGQLVTTLGREDGQQNVQSVTLHYPPGLSGLLTGVKLCEEAQANAGTCGPESEIGETIVSVGLGNDPFTVTGGHAYITGPYNGTSTCTVGSPGCAPFGLSIVNPAAAGPFVLQEGRPVVVRAKIEVNPTTAALTVATNPSGPYAIPHMIEGIPLQIKHVNVNVNRQGFAFNPTSCNPMKIESTISSAEGASVSVSSPFQVTDCQALKFAPKFKVSTSGKTSKAHGASLTTTVSYPNVPQGTDAEIAKVKVELPKHLPSRLTTLQKACTQKQFEENPANCPTASKIGYAVVHTPLLPVPLEGPAIFVSHGDEAFPSLTMVLQGYGVTIDLVGATDIKNGVTSTTFKTVPDQPFSSFELNLPEGPYSALAANGNLCHETKTVTKKKKVKVKVHGKTKTVTRKTTKTESESLVMPNEFVGQNGAVLKEDTNISVTGCAKALHPKKAKSKKRKKAGRK